MAKTNPANPAPLQTGEDLKKNIEEAAYYSWLNRKRYAQAGDELSDWVESEKKVRIGLSNANCPVSGIFHWVKQRLEKNN